MTPLSEYVRGRRAARRGCGGFTLIELLVALTLFGLISVVLFGGLRFGTRAWETGQARIEHLAEIEAVQGLLRRQIAQIMAPTVRPGRRARLTDSVTVFEGETDRVHFAAHVPPHLGVGGIYLFEIGVNDDGRSGRQLDLVWHLYRPDEPSIRTEDIDEEGTLLSGRRTLIEGIEEVEFSYFGVPSEDLGLERDGDWHEDWIDELALPTLIAIKVDFPEGDRRAWPELVVQTRLRPAGDT